MRKLGKAFAIILLFAPLIACAATVSGKALDGQVLEEGTNKPIPGVIVVARWQGLVGTIGHGSGVCYHVESTTTDAQGRFHTAAWQKPSPLGDIAHRRASLYAYKPGYVFVREEGGVIYLKPFTGSREERLRKIAGAAVTCGSAGESKKNLLPLYRKLYEEALPLTVTKEDKYILSNLLFKIEELELPYVEAERRHIERHNAIHKE